MAMQKNDKSTITEIKVEKALKLLDENLHEISEVKVWAKKADVSREWLWKAMKVVYKKPPKVIIREMRYEMLVHLIWKEGLEAGSYPVAIDAGFNNSTALSKFLSTYYETNFTLLKRAIFKGELQYDFKWLNGIHE